MKKAIVRRPLPQTDLLNSADLPDILRRIFRARGVTREEFIDHSLKRLQSVDQLHQVDLAARYLADAVMEGQRILIVGDFDRSEEHTSELQSRENLVCRLLLEKKKKNN